MASTFHDCTLDKGGAAGDAHHCDDIGAIGVNTVHVLAKLEEVNIQTPHVINDASENLRRIDNIVDIDASENLRIVDNDDFDNSENFDFIPKPTREVEMFTEERSKEEVGTNGVKIRSVKVSTKPLTDAIGIREDLEFDIYEACFDGTCKCEHFVNNCLVQLKPCRAYVEMFCRGENDQDWCYILSGVCFGFRVIDENCRAVYECSNYESITKSPTKELMSIRLKSEIEQGILTIVKDVPLCVHSLGSVPKDGDDFRAIVDCSRPLENCVNLYTDGVREKFSYKSVDTVVEGLVEGDFMATVDISNAYRAVHIHPTSSIRQGLSWSFKEETTYMRDNRLCMGLGSSPYVFSMLSELIVRCMIREGGPRVVNYLDDFCIIGHSYEECRAGQLELVHVIRRLGFFINYRKLTNPSQEMRFLGIIIDSIKMQLRLPEDKLARLFEILNDFSGRVKATRLELQRLAGILAHCCKVIQGGRTFSRRVYDMLSSMKRAHYKVRLNEEFRLDVFWWLEFAETFNGQRSIIPPSQPAISVYSDSSGSGFGALHANDWLAGSFKKGSEREMLHWLGHHGVQVSDPGCNTENINVLEMWPVLCATRRWGHLWKDKVVVMVTDNTQVRTALNTGRSINKTTMKWLRQIFWESVTNNFRIESVYIPTECNVICDSLSRMKEFKYVAILRDCDSAQGLCCHHLFNR